MRLDAPPVDFVLNWYCFKFSLQNGVRVDDNSKLDGSTKSSQEAPLRIQQFHSGGWVVGWAKQ